MKKNNLLALLLALVLTLTSVCAFAEGEDPIVGKAYDGEVTVTLSEISDDYESMLAYYLNYYTQYGYAVDEYDVQFQASVAQETVNSALSLKVVDRYAANNGYALTAEKEEALAAQVNAQLDSAREYYESYLGYYGYSGEELAQIVEEELAAAGYTYDNIYENAKLSDTLSYLLDLATEGVSVTEEDAKAAFDAKVEAAKATYAEADAFINDYVNGAEILYTPEGMRLVQTIYFAAADENEIIEGRIQGFSKRNWMDGEGVTSPFHPFF